MNYISQSLFSAIKLITGLDPAIYEIVGASLKFSLIATCLAAVIGIPLGFIIGSKCFPGKGLVLTAVNSLMALPTVVVGLIGYGLLSRQGWLGELGLLFTPEAVILGEFFLSLPMITALSVSAVQSIDPRAALTAKTLGAGRIRTSLTIIGEARFAIFSAIVAGYGRAVSEVGSAMMLGGNIRYSTRTITTSIALETSKGEFSQGLALGIFLLTVSFGINILLHYFQMRGKPK